MRLVELLTSTTRQPLLVAAESHAAVDAIALRLLSTRSFKERELVRITSDRDPLPKDSAIHKILLSAFVGSQPKTGLWDTKVSIERQILADAKVALCTLSAAHTYQHMEFGIVIVDEAAQATELSSLVALRHAKQVVLVGGKHLV